VNTNGPSFTSPYSFTAPSGSYNPLTNSDGATPFGGLVLSGNVLYGTAATGGSSGYGTVFKVETTGLGFTTLHSFTNGLDGANPSAGLVLSGNTLYGTAAYGGRWGNGTVFAISTTGLGFTNLHSFTARSASPPYFNKDGANPSAGLILSGATLYGTAAYGGGSGNGTVFAINTIGPGFTNLYSFTAIDPEIGTNSDGANPQAGLILSGNTLYGTALAGGQGGSGTVFALRLSPPNPIPLSIKSISRALVLTWSDPTFSLQAAPTVTGAYTNVPGAASPYTNVIAGSRMFFRLKQ